MYRLSAIVRAGGLGMARKGLPEIQGDSRPLPSKSEPLVATLAIRPYIILETVAERQERTKVPSKGI